MTPSASCGAHLPKDQLGRKSPGRSGAELHAGLHDERSAAPALTPSGLKAAIGLGQINLHHVPGEIHSHG